jgi:CRISPR-associated protein (TIGR02710 family)
MATDAPVKALLIAMTEGAPAAVAVINRLKPERLCFFLPESSKALVEQSVQPQIAQMPQRWDWIVTPDAGRFLPSFHAIARALPTMMKTWEVQGGELVADMTGATPAMAAALALACTPFCSRVLASDETGNPWDELAAQSRREACDLFNRGAFTAAASMFRQIEWRVSGGQKPLYRAFGDLAEGYGLWERFQYRQAWDKLKGAIKAIEMASVWGGPPGLKELLPPVKQNSGFLEQLVLDPADVKEHVTLDLFAHARRRADAAHDSEGAVAVLLRALEAAAQHRLFTRYGIKSWDVQPEQLPAALQESCRTCLLDDVDGKFKLPLQAQFRALAGLGDPLGQTYLAQWVKLKPLLDAAAHAVLGHGFEPVKPERFEQLWDVVMKVVEINDASLPRFPVLAL